jgi:hypothetical protein
MNGGLETMHNEEMHNLYSSPNVVTAIKQKMR